MPRIQSILNDGKTWEDIFLEALLVPLRNGDLPKIIAYYPAAKVNPFHQALYSKAHEFGYSTTPIVDVQFLREIDWPKGHITLHLHWLGGILKSASSELEAKQACEDFLESLQTLQSRGVQIIWTIHNTLPHQARFIDAEISLRKGVSTIADKIHILTNTTYELLSPFFDIDPQKVFCVPHPSYRDNYKSRIDELSARAELGWDPGAFYFLSFGGIEQYKGFHLLIEAFRIVRASSPERDIRLVIAGPPSDALYIQQLLDILMPNDWAMSLIPRTVPEADVHFYFSACNAVVAPYKELLNSGVALLAANFQRPTIAPNIGAVSEIWADQTDLLYLHDSRKALIEAMTRALRWKPRKSIFLEIESRHNAAKASRSFFNHLSAVKVTPDVQ